MAGPPLPIRPLPLRIHSASRAVDAATAVKRLDPVHPPRRVLHQHRMAVRQLLQVPQAPATVIDRPQHPLSQQPRQLARVPRIALVPFLQQGVVPRIANRQLLYPPFQQIIEPSRVGPFFEDQMQLSPQPLQEAPQRFGLGGRIAALTSRPAAFNTETTIVA